jgi:hypothetical protein
MLVRRSWFDLKPKFFWAVGFTLFLLVIFFRNYFGLIKLNNSGSLSEFVTMLDPIGIFSEAIFNFFSRIIEDYTFYVDAGWFAVGVYFFWFFAIIISLAGILVQNNKSVFYMTLSLPVKRSNWLIVHAGVTAFLVFIIIFSSTISVLAVSNIIGKTYPLQTALVKALFIWLSCFPWIGLSLLVNSFLHNGFKTIMILIIFFIIISNIDLPGLHFFNLHKPFDRYQLHTLALWIELLISILVTIITVYLAIWRFKRNEY